ncbi:MAG: dihydroneopterin aldolase [Spirochaetales bacterium]|nr:dihydroneopterin aldolase [Spirochaetales bacterium]
MELDAIHIKDLLLRCIIGINDNERIKKQDVVINVTLYADLAKAGKSDAIEDTVNYKKLKDKIVELIEASSFFLVEKMANEISNVCFNFDGVLAVRVLAEKPSALRFARSVGVEIFRKKPAR